VPERNLLFLFLHPQADPTCPNRRATVAELAAMLRAQVAAEPGHPRAEELIAGLTTSNAEFAELWGRHDVEETTHGQMRVIHSLVGELNLDWDAYPMPGAPGPVLIVYTAPEGSADAERLQRLADVLGQTSPAPTRAGERQRRPSRQAMR
jgi:MmyB-like transcription regulator ligand binding domain